MKKKVLVGIIIIVVAIVVAGMFSNRPPKDKVNWPSDGAASLLPVPDTKYGSIVSNDESHFLADAQQYSEDKFNQYIEDVKSLGFTVDFSSSDSHYDAKNDAGDDISLWYRDSKKTMNISFYLHDESESVTDSTVETEAPATESKTESTTGTSESSDEIRPATKEALDAYETFMNDYVDFMKKYNDNPSDSELLKEYADYMTKYADFTDKFDKMEDDLNDAELSYYLKVQARVLDKLSEVQ